MSRRFRVVAIGVCIALCACNRQPAKPGMPELVAAATLPNRYIEPRVSGGFRWAPFLASAIDGSAAFRGKAGHVIRDSSSPHAVAVAHLLTGNLDAAQERLETAMRATPNDALLWSDLATARYLAATRRDKPAELPRALAAIDRALELNPELLEALFNRAMILEKLGLRSWAAVAWARYLASDRESGWAVEARAHFEKVRERPHSFQHDLDTALFAARKGDPAPLVKLVRFNPQDARAYGDGMILLPWLSDGESGLRNARLLAKALADVTSDRFLVEYLKAIDSGRAVLPAFSSYVNGRKEYGQQKAALAEQHFRAAAQRARGTPLEDLSLYFAANTVFDQNRIDESEAMMRTVLSRIDRNRYPGLVAEIEWQLGRADGYRGRWNGCLEHLSNARSIFFRLHEEEHVAFIDAIVAETYDHIGKVDEGWRYRVSSWDVLSRGGANKSEPLYAAVAGAIRAELYRNEYASALSLATMFVERLRNANEPEFLTEALIRRARVLQATGNRTSTTYAIAEARRAASRIRDVSTIRRLIAETDVVDALNRREKDPVGAIAFLSGALSVYTTAHESIWITPLYLERGRTNRQIGNNDQALADFNAAIGEIETQRATVTDDDLRTGFLNTEPELFSETTDLLVSEGRGEEAFDVLQRARARTLAEQLGLPPVTATTAARIRRVLRKGELLIVYELIPGGLAIITLDTSCLTVKRVTVSRAQLKEVVYEMQRTIFSNAPIASVYHASAAAWRLLIQPIADQVAGAKYLIIAPDRFLYDVPYAALYDGRFLVENHVITITPGASLLLRLKRPMRFAPALVVGDPDESLPAARTEASRIAESYAAASVLIGPAATVDSFLRAARDASLIHYAGHARSSRTAPGVIPLGVSQTLTSDQIAHYHLTHAPIVVLAACATLRGNAEHVESMPSIARGFLAAGAQTVIGTLWNIPDDTADALFETFHRKLRVSKSAREALAMTQRSFLQLKNKRSHPANWAAAEVLGN